MKNLCPVGSLVAAFVVLAIFAVRAQCAVARAPASTLNPEGKRIDEIAAMLFAQPGGIGRPASDRDVWQKVGQTDRFDEIVSEAAEAMSQPTPRVTKADFDDYNETGRREKYTRAQGRLSRRFSRAVLAECVENTGRFVPDIAASINAICDMPTWVPPYHGGIWDRKGDETYIVDLVSSAEAAALATGDYWLGDKLSPAVRARMRGAMKERIFDPYRNCVIGKGNRAIWWLTGDNNWNSVCNANVVIAAVTVLDDPRERAFFIAAAEKSVRYYLGGIGDDGYCSEGLGYWNYGFSHYVMLADAVFMATGGKLDWMADPRIRDIALFGSRMEIIPGVYPSVADAGLRTKPSAALQNYISRKYDLDLERWETPLGAEALDTGLATSLFAFPSGLAKEYGGVSFKRDTRREWYGEAQFYIGRPGAEQGKAPATGALAVACKGGNNAEHHNHNDVGTYLVALDGECPLVDPGAPVYTRDTFSDKRYEDDIINSWGHPVPLVAGVRQSTGADAKAVLLEKSFSDEKDVLVFDIAKAYECPKLVSLKRSFVFSRGGAGSLTVTDEVKFADPQAFSTALITYGQWKRNDDGTLTVTDNGKSVNVAIEAGGQQYEIRATEVDSEVRADHKPTRIAIDLSEPVTGATVSVKITPVGK
jgi:hypothetical protein